MVNHNERKIVEQYASQGWKCIRGGWPDFIFVKEKDGKIVDWKAVEVKTKNDNLSWEQQVVRELLEQKSIPYKIEVVR